MILDLAGLVLLLIIAAGVYGVACLLMVRLRELEKRCKVLATAVIGHPWNGSARVLFALSSGKTEREVQAATSLPGEIVSYHLDFLVSLGFASRIVTGDGVPRWWQTDEGADAALDIEEWR